jgi:hypothetical protein
LNFFSLKSFPKIDEIRDHSAQCFLQGFEITRAGICPVVERSLKIVKLFVKRTLKLEKHEIVKQL